MKYYKVWGTVTQSNKEVLAVATYPQLGESQRRFSLDLYHVLQQRLVGDERRVVNLQEEYRETTEQLGVVAAVE